MKIKEATQKLKLKNCYNFKQQTDILIDTRPCGCGIYIYIYMDLLLLPYSSFNLHLFVNGGWKQYLTFLDSNIII